MGVLDRACDTDTVATTARSNVVVVNLHEHDAVLDVPQTSVLCTGLVHVVDIAVGGIVLLVNGQYGRFARIGEYEYVRYRM